MHRWLDLSAITLSGLCILHCLAGSLLLAAAAAGADWLGHDAHVWGLALALPLAALALGRGLRRHGRVPVAIIGAGGLLLMAGSLFAGHGGAVVQKLGAIAQQLPGPDIYPALERGVIDATEWVGPHDDEKLGFQRVARFYYAPGWWEYSPSIDLMIHPAAYEALPAQYKAILEAACTEGWHWMMARYDMLNPQALRRLVAQGTQLRVFSREVLTASYRAAQELYGEIGSSNARFRRLHAEWDKYRMDQVQWFRIAEDTQANFQSLMAQQAQSQAPR